jgi:N-acetyl-anhydromuramoyl-L-alanine amidase
MEVDRATGLLAGVRSVPSPFQNERPAGAGVELVVIHGISLPPGDFGGPWIERLFLGRLSAEAHPFFAGLQALRVSAHLLVRRSGRIVQYVPLHRRAWHAGTSSWRGREGVNDFSIGIELEGAEGIPYEGAQYRAAAAAVAAVAAVWPRLAEPDRLVGHADVAPGRKTDPWPSFDWERFRRLIASERLPRVPR